MHRKRLMSSLLKLTQRETTTEIIIGKMNQVNKQIDLLEVQPKTKAAIYTKNENPIEEPQPKSKTSSKSVQTMPVISHQQQQISVQASSSTQTSVNIIKKLGKLCFYNSLLFSVILSQRWKPIVLTAH